MHFDDEIARLFQSIGLRADDNPAVQPYDDHYRWVNADKEVLLDVNWKGTGRSGWNTSNFFHQPDLEREINKIVASERNAQVFRGWEAVGLSQDDHGATVTARPPRERRGAGLPRPVRRRRGRRELLRAQRGRASP